MKKILIASASAVALFGLAACSDNTDATTTQSTQPDVMETQPVAPADPSMAPAPAPETDDTTTQSITPPADEPGLETDTQMAPSDDLDTDLPRADETQPMQ